MSSGFRKFQGEGGARRQQVVAARDDPHLELEATVLGNISSVIVPSNFPVRLACKQHRHSTNLGYDFLPRIVLCNFNFLPKGVHFFSEPL